MKNFIIGIVVSVIVFSGVIFYQSGKVKNFVQPISNTNNSSIPNTTTYVDDCLDKPNKYISKKEAKSLALNYIGGGKVVKIKFDNYFDPDDQPDYEIKVKFNCNIYELEVNAITGVVTDFDIDND